MENYSSCVQDKRGKSVPYLLLKLPSTHLEWFSSSFGLFLPSVYGGGFQIIPGNLPRRLQMNSV